MNIITSFFFTVDAYMPQKYQQFQIPTRIKMCNTKMTFGLGFYLRFPFLL